MGLEPVAE